MNPTRLELHNFGAIPEADIDLSGLSLAAITGANGAGKSTTFTIAPLFALFGSGKSGCTADDMVRMGEQDAAVTLEFEHRGDDFRVVRTRSKAGRGKSSLELQRREGDKWASLSGATIKETEERIRSLLGLDEETFTSSSMILQGRSNEFTALPPGQRKQILSQILGLEGYETLRESAKFRRVSGEAKLETMHRRMDEAMPVSLEFDAVNGAIAEICLQLSTMKESEANLETQLSDAMQERAKAEGALQKLESIHARIGDVALRMNSIDFAMRNYEKEKKDALALIEEESFLIEKRDLYERAKTEIVRLEAKEARKTELAAMWRSVKADIDVVQDQRSKIHSRIDRHKSVIAERTRIESDAAELDESNESLGWIRDMRDKVVEIDTAISAKEIQGHQIMLDIERCETSARRLTQSGCVDPDAAKATPCSFLSAAVEDAGKIPLLKEQMRKVVDEIESLRLKRDALDYNDSAYSKLTNRVHELREAKTKLYILQEAEEAINEDTSALAENFERRHELTTRLDEIEKEGAMLKEELQNIPGLRGRLAAIEPYMKRLAEIPAAKERVANLSREIASKKEDFESATKEITLLEGQMLAIHAPDIDGLNKSVAELKDRLSESRDAIRCLSMDLGAAESKRKRVEDAQSVVKSLNTEMTDLAAEVTRWSTLEKAFGRDGIPALIIENAIPELERISNEILGQMSQGRHSLRFETQRELKSRAGMAETLDIIVSDWSGSRPYETFSGGEQLRIDFAIRFALAELLARRAGSRIEFLVIDEGLGSQDREHRDLVLEAIRSVADRFRKVLVITHIEEASGVFPQQIHFVRDGENVTVEVA